jgi:hypothetical protein
VDICYIITINYLTHRVAFPSFVCSESDFWLLWVLLRGPIHSFACSQPPQVHCVHPRLGKCALLRGQCTHNYQLLYHTFVCLRQWELSGKYFSRRLRRFTQKPCGSLYIMETFAERAHSACAPRPDGKAQASACAPLRILS